MDKLAIASVVCGILSCILWQIGSPFYFGPIAIITGLFGLRTKDKNSKKFYWTGLALGAISLLITIIILSPGVRACCA